MSKDANYRKHNDRTLNSSTYHKKEAEKDVKDYKDNLKLKE